MSTMRLTTITGARRSAASVFAPAASNAKPAAWSCPAVARGKYEVKPAAIHGTRSTRPRGVPH